VKSYVGLGQLEKQGENQIDLCVKSQKYLSGFNQNFNGSRSSLQIPPVSIAIKILSGVLDFSQAKALTVVFKRDSSGTLKKIKKKINRTK
jgi:hypothetical protein